MGWSGVLEVGWGGWIGSVDRIGGSERGLKATGRVGWGLDRIGSDRVFIKIGLEFWLPVGRRRLGLSRREIGGG